MKGMKTLLIVVLAVVLITSGCTSGQDSTNKRDNNLNNGNHVEQNNLSNEEGGEGAVQTPQEEPVPDLGGRVIRIAAWWDLTPEGVTASEKARLEKIEEVEEKYNITIEFVSIPFDQYMDTFTASVLAGEPFADIVQLEYKRAIAPVLNGQLLKLAEYTTPESDVNNEQKRVYKLPPLAGEEYSFDTPTLKAVGIHYNRDLFRRLGLPDLHQLYHEGNWNWETFLDIARQATRDTNNDGAVDTWGFSGWTGNVIPIFIAANGGQIVNDAEWVETLSDPRTIEAMEFVQRLYNEENVVKVKSGLKTDYNEFHTWQDGDVAMFIGYEWMLGNEDFEVGVVPIPLGPQGTPEYTYADMALSGRFIPVGTEDPAIVYKIFEELEDVPMFEEYVGQEYMESRYKTQEDIDMVREHIYGTGRVDVHEGYPDFPMGTIIEEIIVQNLSVTSTVEKYRQQAQAAIDALSNQ